VTGVCSTDFAKDANNLAFPVTSGQDFSSNPIVISKIEHFYMYNAPAVNNTLTLKNGNTARWVVSN
jgi:hypothetical protein